MPNGNVVRIEDHPLRLRDRVRDLARDISKVVYSSNINDLASSRAVPVSFIWACLESGEVDPDWVSRNELGVYGKLNYLVGGTEIEVDFLIDNEGVLNVLYATADEEE